MFKSTTDYSVYPTVAGLSENDRKKLYRRPLSESDILKRFEKIDQENRTLQKEVSDLKNKDIKKSQEIKTLKETFEIERQGFTNRIIFLENKVIKLESQTKETLSTNARNNAKKESLNNSTGKETLNLKQGQSYTMGTYGGEKIQWKVLKVEGGKALLLSEKELDSRPYQKEFEDITWEKSDLRQWLNQEFVNQAFSAGEKQKLATTQVKNPDNPGSGTNGGNTTRDQVFLLSIDEAKEYFKTDEERICYPTGYAKKQGVYVDDRSGSCLWWLRSPGDYGYYAALVSNVGKVNAHGSLVHYNRIGVRPALWINL